MGKINSVDSQNRIFREQSITETLCVSNITIIVIRTYLVIYAF